MGSNRVLPMAPSVAPTSQTHSPCGSSPSPTHILDCSSSLIKSEPVTEVDIALTVSCHSGNWEESYQDLSAWCSGKAHCSPVTYQSQALDESPLSGTELQGEIDFDLRKSEEIASVPLEEDSSFNLWGAASQTQDRLTYSDPYVSAAASTGKSGSVLINDCWLYESEASKIAKGLKPDQTPTATITIPAAPEHFLKASTPTVFDGEEGAVKENMNPTSALPDLLKMELQQSLERIASHMHPGTNTRIKAADLMKILQEQMVMLNKKKYRAPAAVSDLHNQRASPHQGEGTSASLFSTPDNSEDFFKFDPFENLFSPPVRTQSAQQSSEQQFATDLLAHPAIVAPAYVQSAFRPVVASASSQNGSSSRTSKALDVFNSAHQEVLKSGPKQSPGLLHPNLKRQPLPASHRNPAYAGVIVNKRDKELSLQLPAPRVMPEMDANLDALLNDAQSFHLGIKSEQGISTPEVLKPLVDPESFDLLSYLCDDKVNTPPVYLEHNPFQFPQPSNSQNSSILDAKRSVMVVRPLASSWSEISGDHGEKLKEKESPVIVELKPEILPSVHSEEEDINTNSSIGKKNISMAHRPSRSQRKRKYSEDYVFSPSSPADDTTWTGRRKRPSSRKTDSEDEFTLPPRKSRRRSVVAPHQEVENDNEEVEEVETQKQTRTVGGGSRSRTRSRIASTSSESDKYRELRDRNNEASRKSRLTRKAREQELGKQADVLTRENRILKVKVEEMENLVKKLRESLLQSMMLKKT